MISTVLAKREHLPHIARLEGEIFSEPCSEKGLELFLSEDAFCVCALEGEALASYCTLVTVLDEAQIVNVATDISLRGRGYARAVLEAVFEECKKRGIVTVSLEVRESNVPAISLYQGLGFSVEGKRRDFYKNPRENALVMIKNLD